MDSISICSTMINHLLNSILLSMLEKKEELDKLDQHLTDFVRFKLFYARHDTDGSWTLRRASLAIIDDKVCFDVTLRYTMEGRHHDVAHVKSWSKADFEFMQYSFLNVIDDTLKFMTKPVKQESP